MPFREIGQFSAFSLLIALALAATARRARAEPLADLRAVEDAYREVDFEAVEQRAEAAIRAGGHDPVSMARLEFLLGVASAALDKPEEARKAFVYLLGIDPSQKLDRELSPRLRAPYLEARGFWSSNRERLSASALAESDALTITLSDPAKMVSHVRVSIRGAGQLEFQDSTQPAAPSLRVALPASAPSRGLEVALALLDEFGNVLAERGSKLAPLPLARKAVESSAVLGLQARDATGVRPPNYLLPGTLAVLGAASGATGVYFHVRRERAASDWNGRGCEQPGKTRGEQCADVEKRLRQAEWLTVGFYAAGGTLLALSVVTFIANGAPTSEQPSAAVSCDPAAGSTLGVWCAGRF